MQYASSFNQCLPWEVPTPEKFTMMLIEGFNNNNLHKIDPVYCLDWIVNHKLIFVYNKKWI